MWRVQSKELRRRRIEKMLDQPELARISGVSERRIRSLEASDGRVTRATIACLAKAFGCTLAEIGRAEQRSEEPSVAGRPVIAASTNGASRAVADRPRMDDLRAIERAMPAPDTVAFKGARVPKLTVLAYQQCFTAYLAHDGDLYWIEGFVAGERGLPPPEAALIGGRSGEGARFDVRCPVGRDGEALAVTVHTATAEATLAMQRRADAVVRLVARVVTAKEATDRVGLTFFMRERPSPWGLVVERVLEAPAARKSAKRSR